MGMLTDNEQETINALKRAGFGDDDIAAIMGNIAVETGNTFDFTQEQKGGGGGYGLFQFTGSHKDDYFDWLKGNNIPDSHYSQSKFVYDNIYSDKPYTQSKPRKNWVYGKEGFIEQPSPKKFRDTGFDSDKAQGYGRDLGWRDRGLLQRSLDEGEPTPMALSKGAQDRVEVSKKTRTFADVYAKAGKPHMDRRIKSAHEWHKKWREEELY